MEQHDKPLEDALDPLLTLVDDGVPLREPAIGILALLCIALLPLPLLLMVAVPLFAR